MATHRTGAERPSLSGSLAVVGTGIQLVRQLTLEAREEIERADEVLFVVADPAAAAWLGSLNAEARSLSGLYSAGVPRDRVYEAMVGEILAAVRGGRRVCAVFYGHPGVYVQPSHEAIRRAREEGFSARMLPAVSAEDCLFADLGVDPGEHGWQSFEATDFLLRGRRSDPESALVLWQVDAVGKRDSSLEPEAGALGRLGDALVALYPPGHEAVFYRASAYPVAGPDVVRVTLGDLTRLDAAPAPTLYVPPLRRS